MAQWPQPGEQGRPADPEVVVGRPAIERAARSLSSAARMEPTTSPASASTRAQVCESRSSRSSSARSRTSSRPLRISSSTVAAIRRSKIGSDHSASTSSTSWSWSSAPSSATVALTSRPDLPHGHAQEVEIALQVRLLANRSLRRADPAQPCLDARCLHPGRVGVRHAATLLPVRPSAERGALAHTGGEYPAHEDRIGRGRPPPRTAITATITRQARRTTTTRRRMRDMAATTGTTCTPATTRMPSAGSSGSCLP